MSPHAVDRPKSMCDFPPTPPVQTLDVSDSTEAIVEALAVAGGCIVKNFVSLDIIDQLHRDFQPLLEAEKDKWGGEWP